MDSGSLASAETPKEHTFTVKWDIHNFNLVLDLYNKYPIFSHSIKIYHHGLSLWRLGLYSTRDPMEFFLLRVPCIADEHGKIFVRFKVCLVNAQDVVYFGDVSEDLTYQRVLKGSMMTGQSFVLQPELKSKIRVDKNLLQIHDNKLRVRCEIKVSIDYRELKERNNTDDLYYLHCDLDILLKDEDYVFYDIFIHMGKEICYGVNATLLKARLPGYQLLVKEYISISEIFARDRGNDPHSNLNGWDMEGFLHVIDHILVVAMFNVWSREPPDPFIQRVPLNSLTLAQSFTPTVCWALLSYLYTGSVEMTDQQDAVSLSNIARCLFLNDLVRKLEEFPPGCHSVTEMVSMWHKFRLDFPKLFQNWGEVNYEPIVKTLTLSDLTRTHKRTLILTLRLIRSVEVVTLECRLPEENCFPTLLAITLSVKDSMGNHLRTLTIKHTYTKDESWCPNVCIKTKDLTSKDVECLFHAVYENESRLTCPVYERFDFDRPMYSVGVVVWSVRHLGADLKRSLNDHSTCDVVLVAQGRTLLAHMYILCSRSERFLKELVSKLNMGHKVTHLVRGVEYNALVELVKYLYSGDPDFKNSRSVEKLLEIAQEFGVHSLVNTCKSFLESKMSS